MKIVYFLIGSILIVSASVALLIKFGDTLRLPLNGNTLSTPRPVISNGPLNPDEVKNSKDVLTIGETIDEDGLAADTKEFQPFIDYLIPQLKSFGVTRGQFVGATSVSELAQLAHEGKLDLIIDSAFPVYVVDTLAGAQPLADRWKGGAQSYHTAFFVKKDSPIKTLDDLKGHMLAFDSTSSTVGYFLPKAYLLRRGYTLTQKNSPTDPVSTSEIGYVFVHGNVYDSVTNGVTPVGAESELEIDAYFKDTISNYRVIERTPDIPRFLVATSSDMDPAMRNSILSALLAMDKTPEGKQVLTAFADTAKFTPITSSDAAFGVIKSYIDIVEDEIIKQ